MKMIKRNCSIHPLPIKEKQNVIGSLQSFWGQVFVIPFATMTKKSVYRRATGVSFSMKPKLASFSCKSPSENTIGIYHYKINEMLRHSFVLTSCSGGKTSNTLIYGFLTPTSRGYVVCVTYFACEKDTALWALFQTEYYLPPLNIWRSLQRLFNSHGLPVN